MMYNNPFNVYNPQPAIDRINNQMAELERQKAQLQQVPIQQPTNLTQNFQLAPTNNSIRYANSIEEVQKSIIIAETPFFSNDMSIVWVKDIKGNIKTYELTEIVPKDEKDLQIEYLQAQIEELKKGMYYEPICTDVDADEDEPDTAGNDNTVRTTIEKDKSSIIQKLSTSKKRK